MQEMLWKEAQINWNDYPSFFKKGTYFARRIVRRKFTAEEIARMPVHARPSEDEMIERQHIVELDIPPLGSIVNKAGVLFKGEEPEKEMSGENT